MAISFKSYYKSDNLIGEGTVKFRPYTVTKVPPTYTVHIHVYTYGWKNSSDTVSIYDGKDSSGKLLKKYNDQHGGEQSYKCTSGYIYIVLGWSSQFPDINIGNVHGGVTKIKEPYRFAALLQVTADGGCQVGATFND